MESHKYVHVDDTAAALGKYYGCLSFSAVFTDCKSY